MSQLEIYYIFYSIYLNKEFIQSKYINFNNCDIRKFSFFYLKIYNILLNIFLFCLKQK